ncbi:sigma-70 family RNA polymerase sigma factor [Arthrobacter sp. MMS24-S77]
MAGRFRAAAVASDRELIAMVRAGNAEAYEGLYTRHVSIASSVARKNVDNPSDADDVVAEAFQAVLQSLKSGGGPREFFRAYLLSAVTRLAHHTNRKARRTTPADIEANFDHDVVEEDPVIRAFESRTVARAYRALPERWQSVLWYLDVEGMKPAAVAPIMGLSPNAVSALGVRAREGLRRQYLQSHINDPERAGCAEFRSQLGAYLRGGLSKKNASGVRSHLDGCTACTAVLLELEDVRGTMRAVLLPLVTGIPLTAWDDRSKELGAAGVLQGTSTGTTLVNPVVMTAAGALVATIMFGGVSDSAGLTAQDQLDSLGVESPRNDVPAGPLHPAPTPSWPRTPGTSAAQQPPSPVPPPAPPRSYETPPDTVPQPGGPSPLPSPALPPLPGPGVVSESIQTAGVQGSVSVSDVNGDPRTRSMIVAFSITGGVDLRSATATFSLSKHASIDLASLEAPSGWTCHVNPGDSGALTCTTGVLKSGTTEFHFTINTTNKGHGHTLQYNLNGPAIETNSYTYGF